MHERINSAIPVEKYLFKLPWSFTVVVYLFKVNNVNTRTTVEICSKLRIKTPERLQWLCCDVFIVKFEQITHIDLVFHCWFWTTKCRFCYFSVSLLLDLNSYVLWDIFDLLEQFRFWFAFYVSIFFCVCVHQM